MCAGEALDDGYEFSKRLLSQFMRRGLLKPLMEFARSEAIAAGYHPDPIHAKEGAFRERVNGVQLVSQWLRLMPGRWYPQGSWNY